MPMSPYYQALRDRIGTELLLIPGVAAVVRDEQGRILVQKTTHDVWSLPAGAIEPGEAPAQAAVREVLEETGLVVRATRLLGLFGGPKYRWGYPNGDRVEGVVSLFECVKVGGALIAANDETQSLQWFHIDEMPNLAVPYPSDVLRGESNATFFEWDDSWLGAHE